MGAYLKLFLADSHVLHGLLLPNLAHVFRLVSLTVRDVRVSDEVCSFPVLHLSSPVPAQTFALCKSIRCVWIGGSIRIGSTEQGVNEAAQEIIFRSVTSGVEGSKERILSSSTETLRCEIHRREVSSMLQQTKRQQDAERGQSDSGT